MSGWMETFGPALMSFLIALTVLVGVAFAATEAIWAMADLEAGRVLVWWSVGLALFVEAAAELQALDEGRGGLVSFSSVAEFVDGRPGILAWLLLLGFGAAGAALLARRALGKRQSEQGDPLQARRFAAIGTLGENRVACALEELGWPFLRNVVIVRRSWSVEIDAIVRAPDQIVLIEAKTYSGVVFGDPQEAQWVQQSRAGTRQIYSPVRQSEAHLAAVRTVLGDLPVRMCAIIVSAGNAHWEGALKSWVVPVEALAEALRTSVKARPWGVPCSERHERFW